MSWRSRLQFLAIAATTMRRILVDHARRRNSLKRGGAATRLPLEEIRLSSCERPVDVLAVDEALQSLASRSSTMARIVELRFFGGLTNLEISDLLEVSLSTVERQWRMARAWLYTRLSGAPV
jgi:RNA polymerase sigma factor (TIGR02999 family)